MGSSVFLFCLGVAIGTLFVAGIVWPSSRFLYFMLEKKRSFLLFCIGGGCSIIGIGVLIYVLYITLMGYLSPPGYSEEMWYYRFYTITTSWQFSQIILGIFMGPIFFYWLHYFHLPGPSEAQSLNHSRLTIAICVVIVFSITLPYMHRWFATATSIEISTLAKITMDSKQSNGSNANSFVASFGSTGASASVFKGEEIVSALGLLEQMVGPTEKNSMIDRDNSYSSLFLEGPLSRSPPQEKLKISPTEGEALEAERELLSLFRPITACLNDYSKEFRDYRLFLLDIRPLIVDLTTISRAYSKRTEIKEDDFIDAQKQLIKDISELKRSAIERLEGVSGEVSRACSFDVPEPKRQLSRRAKFPYRTILLAYFLSAIGSSDTAILELEDWISRHRENGNPWYIARAQIEQGYLLEKVLQNGLKSPIYQRFIRSNIELLDNLFANSDLEKWKHKDKCNNASEYEQQIVFTYLTQINYLVKSHSDLDNISSDFIERSSFNKEVDMKCFYLLKYVAQDPDAWKAEFFVTYANALIVSSYDERLYGKAQHSDQIKYRDVAKKYLYDAIDILNKSIEREREKTKPEQNRKIYWQPTWENTLISAKAAMRSIIEN